MVVKTEEVGAMAGTDGKNGDGEGETSRGEAIMGAVMRRIAAARSPPVRCAKWRSILCFIEEFHRFLMALSLRPGSNFAISAHRLRKKEKIRGARKKKKDIEKG